jgi:RNA polymerase sigma factor (sigma-70 family)
MAVGRFGGVASQLTRLFDAGTVAGLAESQLLERFIADRDEAAFEALVARHGPTVLSVCRRLLDDPRDVEDAFQGTFLVLVKKAATIRDRDRLGSWLYGVAHRVAARARADARKRRARERRGVEVAAEAIAVHGPTWDDFGPTLHEELGRLPEKYRAPVVLCDLEGQTHEDAARHLHWPVGTVKGRLFRARNLLRERLTRRGLAVPSAGIVAVALARESAAAVVSSDLLQSTVRAAMGLAAGKAVTAGLVPATAAALADGTTQAMFIGKFKLVAAGLVAMAVVGTGAGVMAVQEGSQGAGAKDETKTASDQQTKGKAAVPKDTADKDGDLRAELEQNARRRIELARDYFQTCVALAGGGQLDQTQVMQATRRLMEAERDAAKNEEGRVEALKSHVKRLRDLAETAFGRVKNGSLPRSALVEAQLALEEANSELLKTKTGGAAPKSEHTLSREDDEDEARNRAIREALGKPLSMPFSNPTPLEDVIKYIKASTSSPYLPDGLPIYVDPQGLATAEAKMQSPVTLNLDGVRLKTTLRLMLKQLHLGYYVKEGLLIITTLEDWDYRQEAAREGRYPRFDGMGGMMGGSVPQKAGVQKK